RNSSWTATTATATRTHLGNGAAKSRRSVAAPRSCSGLLLEPDLRLLRIRLLHHPRRSLNIGDAPLLPRRSRALHRGRHHLRRVRSLRGRGLRRRPARARHRQLHRVAVVEAVGWHTSKRVLAGQYLGPEQRKQLIEALKEDPKVNRDLAIADKAEYGDIVRE